MLSGMEQSPDGHFSMSCVLIHLNGDELQYQTQLTVQSGAIFFMEKSWTSPLSPFDPTEIMKGRIMVLYIQGLDLCSLSTDAPHTPTALSIFKVCLELNSSFSCLHHKY